MNLNKILFKRKKSNTLAEKDIIEFYGEFLTTGLNSYATYQEIKEAIIREIVNGLKEDINLKIEALKPEIAEQIIRANKLNI